MESDLPALVRSVLLPAMQPYGFELVSEEAQSVSLCSPRLEAQMSLSPRGEFELAVHPHESELWEGWTYVGMLGRANLADLVHLATTAVTADPRILNGDDEFFASLRDASHAAARAQTERAAGGAPPALDPSRLP